MNGEHHGDGGAVREGTRRSGGTRRSATVRDVARRAGVSNGTVSRVLNRHSNVAPLLREKVLQAAGELGYVPRAATESPRAAARPVSVGFLLTLPHLPGREDQMTSAFWAGVLHGAEGEARLRGIRVVYASLPAGEPELDGLRRRLDETESDAVLLVGSPAEATAAAARGHSRAVVLVDSWAEGHEAVLFDYAEAARHVVAQLVEAGHRDIAFLGGPFASPGSVRNALPAVEMRARGLRDALAHAGVPFRPELCAASDMSRGGGYRAVARLLADGPPFTALFCANDHTASGALQALQERGLSVPGDVSVVTTGDEVAPHTSPALTTVRFDTAALGASALRRLTERLSAGPGGATATTLLPGRPVSRGSVAPPRS